MTPQIPVELGCPQCGAPVILEETDRILSCGFCRVRLCLAFQGTASYRLTTSDLPEAGLLYVPYWRYRGMEFSVEGLEIRHRVADHSHLAIRASGLPPTLGFRPQVLRLKPMSAEKGNQFLKPELSFEQVRASTNGSVPGQFDGAGDPRSGRALETLVGETVHLIHSPVLHTDDGFWDPILRRPLVKADAAALSRLARDQSAGKSIRFLPMICPTCGWDLAGEKDTLAPVCRNCHSIWDSGEGRLSRLPFGVSSSGSKGKGDLHLPFWKIRASAPDLQLETQGDLIRLANVPRVVHQDMSARNLDYYVAAFKVHPQLFLRLARSFTLGQPARGLTRELPKSPLHPVTLPLAEALETLPILVGSMAVPKKTYLPKIAGLRFKHIDSQLVFFPFEPKGTELIQNDIGMSISRNALGMGRLI